MVNYNPQQDPTIPCADAGISFSKGNILEIVDQTDALWWQARKFPSDTCCAGLIPSSCLLKRYEMPPTTQENRNMFGVVTKASGAFFKKNKDNTLLPVTRSNKELFSVANRKQRELWWSQPYLPHACMHICKPRLSTAAQMSITGPRPRPLSSFSLSFMLTEVSTVEEGKHRFLHLRFL